VTTPDDIRAGYRAMLNQIPATMVATQGILMNLATLGSVRPKGSSTDISTKALHKMLVEQKAVFSVCIMGLENRIERLEGRPGIPDDRLEAIMSEFRSG
jgi:hypothetical protein